MTDEEKAYLAGMVELRSAIKRFNAIPVPPPKQARIEGRVFIIWHRWKDWWQHVKPDWMK